MRVGWLADQGDVVGGAELTQAEFRAASPNEVEIIDLRPGECDQAVDIAVVHNCMDYSLDDLEQLGGARVVKYWHDVGPWLRPAVRDWLRHGTVSVCCSPLQAEHINLTNAELIPPPVDLGRFADAGSRVNGDRAGAVSVGSWRNHGKAPHKAAEWALRNGGIDFFGGGPFAPPGSREVPYDQMPKLLATYQTFVFLPTVIEPFGRIVAEAWAAGCEIVTNWLVGARYWLEEDPDAIDTAAEDFWRVVLGV
jgi:glycosyltransferase involved in cell wall biosynthesis